MNILIWGCVIFALIWELLIWIELIIGRKIVCGSMNCFVFVDWFFTWSWICYSSCKVFAWFVICSFFLWHVGDGCLIDVFLTNCYFVNKVNTVLSLVYAVVWNRICVESNLCRVFKVCNVSLIELLSVDYMCHARVLLIFLGVYYWFLNWLVVLTWNFSASCTNGCLCCLLDCSSWINVMDWYYAFTDLAIVSPNCCWQCLRAVNWISVYNFLRS